MPFKSIINSRILDTFGNTDNLSLSKNKQRGQSITYTINDSKGKPKWIAKFFDYLKDCGSVFATVDMSNFSTLEELIENIDSIETTVDIEPIIDYIEIQKRCFARYVSVCSKESMHCFPKLILSDSEIKIENSFYGFLIEEFVSGMTLENRLKGSIEEKYVFVYDFLLQMSGILNELTKNSIVHRDISPDNIIVSDAGEYVLIDPGVVKIEDGNLTKSHLILGKKNYASPEQYYGNAKLSTFKSDLYAVGIIAIEIILGYNPLKELRNKSTEPHKELLKQYNRSIEDSLLDVMGENSSTKRLSLIINKMIQINDWDRFDSIETYINTLRTLEGKVNSK